VLVSTFYRRYFYQFVGEKLVRHNAIGLSDDNHILQKKYQDVFFVLIF